MFSLPDNSLLLVSIVVCIVMAPLMRGLVHDARAQIGVCIGSRARYISR